LVELPSRPAGLAGGDAVDICPWWVLLSYQAHMQRPECRRFKSGPPDQTLFVRMRRIRAPKSHGRDERLSRKLKAY